MNRPDSVTNPHLEMNARIALDDMGIGFRPRKKVRVFEIVTGYTVVLSAFIGLCFVWFHWIG